MHGDEASMRLWEMVLQAGPINGLPDLPGARQDQGEAEEERKEVNGLALCSGIGGIDLGLKLAIGDNYRTVCHVEREAYAASVIVARMAEKALDQAPIWDDLKTFDGKPWRGVVDIVTAGYPCQPFSLAGKRRGADDPRHLWPSVARVIREVEPTLVFCENVPGHINLGFREVAGELQEMGYRVAALLRSAADLGSTHERERLFILGYRDGERGSQQEGSKPKERRRTGDSSGGFLAYNCCKRLEGIRERASRIGQELSEPTGSRLLFPPDRRPENWREVDEALKPAVPRMAHGSADRVDSIRSTGNAVVPCVAAAAFVELVQIMDA